MSIFYHYNFLLCCLEMFSFIMLLILLFYLLYWSYHAHLFSTVVHQFHSNFTWHFALFWPYIPSYSCNCVKFKFDTFLLPSMSDSLQLSVTQIPDNLMPSSGLYGNSLVTCLHKYILIKYAKHVLSIHFAYAA